METSQRVHGSNVYVGNFGHAGKKRGVLACCVPGLAFYITAVITLGQFERAQEMYDRFDRYFSKDQIIANPQKDPDTNRGFTYNSQGNNTRKNEVLSVHKELSVLCRIQTVSSETYKRS